MKGKAIVDADGFTLVRSKKKRRRAIPGTKRVIKKKEPTVPLSFYRFSHKLAKQEGKVIAYDLAECFRNGYFATKV